MAAASQVPPRNHAYSHSGVISLWPFAEQCCSVGLYELRRTQNSERIWGHFVKDLVIELILMAMIVIPLVADSLEPCRVVHRNSSGTFRKLGRTH